MKILGRKIEGIHIVSGFLLLPATFVALCFAPIVLIAVWMITGVGVLITISDYFFCSWRSKEDTKEAFNNIFTVFLISCSLMVLMGYCIEQFH